MRVISKTKIKCGDYLINVAQSTLIYCYSQVCLVLPKFMVLARGRKQLIAFAVVGLQLPSYVL